MLDAMNCGELTVMRRTPMAPRWEGNGDVGLSGPNWRFACAMQLQLTSAIDKCPGRLHNLKVLI